MIDVDHLHKLVAAVLEEGEATNDSGPAHDALVDHLDELSGRSTLLACLESCFTLWVRSSNNRVWGASEVEARTKIIRALGIDRTKRAIEAAGVAPTPPPTASGRHG